MSAIAKWEFPVDWSKVREFARAVGDDHWNADPPVPPPTFPVVLSAEFVERLVTEILELDRSRAVHGEQEDERQVPDARIAVAHGTGGLAFSTASTVVLAYE